jgi:hypothetical protein
MWAASAFTSVVVKVRPPTLQPLLLFLRQRDDAFEQFHR